MSLVKILAMVIAITISFFHWIGIVISGAVIGFLAKSYKSALLFSSLYAIAFWASFIAYSATLGVFDKLINLPLTYLSLALTLAVAVVSSTLRAFR
ncbi:MAG: hypothetical protein QXW59_05725 [Archaeoglobaceae archaeon]